MKFELLPFQTKAVRRLRRELSRAKEDFTTDNETQAISFTAPTGAGKTIMLAALAENIYRGDENYPAQPDAILVWLSDSPELNQQSLNKFYFNADGINHSQLVMIDDTFKQKTLDDGKIYFLNTQKLGKNSNLTKHSDFRQYTIWETLQNTIKAKTDKIYFIIDEAHRGMKGTSAARATTIMQKFIKGSAEDNFDAVPIVIGVSATIERFNNLVKNFAATHPVAVTQDEVKASGLLKEKIIVIYPDEQTSTSVAKDMAILEAASDEWKDKCAHWRQYLGENSEKNFNPIFVVQVENGNANKISATDLDTCLKKISQRTGINFSVDEVVHTFGETADLTINNLRVPYCEPSRISGDEKVRVVFFKENLSTGWDCPQAETMMSFRRAVDATYIAQLLGRMIRTPLQRHIELDDTLNEVRLYLPCFDKNTVQEILDAFRQNDGGAIPAEIFGEQLGDIKIATLTVRGVNKIPASTSEKISVETNQQPTENFSAKTNQQPPENFSAKTNQQPPEKFSVDKQQPSELTLTPKDTQVKPIESAFDRAEIVKAINSMALISYSVRSVRINDYLKSLFQIAHFLTRSMLSFEAFDTALDDVAALIRDYVDKLKAAGEYDTLNRQAKEFKLSAQIFDAFGEGVTQAVSQDLFVTTDTDIERQFRQAEARLKNAGVANRYLKNFADDIDDGKIDVILFAANNDCLAQLENFAKNKFHELNDAFRRKTVNLSDALKNEYNKIISDGDIVSKHNFNLPATIQIPHDIDGKEYSDHLFVDKSTGTATIKLNGWEENILREEQRRADFVCWLRNPPRKSWSLCIPYQDEQGKTQAFYPDFLIVRRDNIGYVVDILEPHDPNRRDNLGKAKGFADYAKENILIGRLQLIRDKNLYGQKIFTRLDMSKGAIREKISHAASNAELDSIFAEHGKSCSDAL